LGRGGAVEKKRSERAAPGSEGVGGGGGGGGDVLELLKTRRWLCSENAGGGGGDVLELLKTRRRCREERAADAQQMIPRRDFIMLTGS
jgi:hypothetical protein